MRMRSSEWRNAVDRYDHASGVARVEFDAVDRGQEIDSQRWATKLDDCVGGREIALLQADVAESEVSESLQQTAGVRRVRSDPDVEVLREARVAVRGERVGANDQKFVRSGA